MKMIHEIRHFDEIHDHDVVEKARTVFAVIARVCIKALESECLSSFLQSKQYAYVLSLKAKESVILRMEDFKAVRVLAEGRFGDIDDDDDAMEFGMNRQKAEAAKANGNGAAPNAWGKK